MSGNNIIFHSWVLPNKGTLLSVAMKLSIGVVFIITLVILGVWQADIANDKEKKVKITKPVLAYDNWECGYQNQPNCKVVFEVVTESEYDVQRIRYGKDFMAIKIMQKGLRGWVFSDKEVQIVAGQNT